MAEEKKSQPSLKKQSIKKKEIKYEKYSGYVELTLEK